MEAATKAHFWRMISQKILPHLPFAVHLAIFNWLYPNWHEHPETAPAWTPNAKQIKNTHLWDLMTQLKMDNYQALHAWSVNHYQDFWQLMITKLAIQFHNQPNKICDLSAGIESPQWLVGAKLNIVNSCFTAPSNAIALRYQDQNKKMRTMTYDELNRLSNRIANSLVQQGFGIGDAIAIVLPMTCEAVAIYLGIIKMGGIVVSIADSFSSEEMATRLQIAKAKAIFTQDEISRAQKHIPLYKKIIVANAPLSIVLSNNKELAIKLRDGDLSWPIFLSDNDNFSNVPCQPMDNCNILFSSGTTSTPKAIPWNHTTAIKAASDAYLHHDIHAQDIVNWPTNLGWMMGPWLIFAALINQASIAIYPDVPTTREFGEFIRDAKVTMLGLVPTIVAHWRQSGCMKNLNWSAIKLFSSTGECSNAEDMFYLMSLANYKPIIEYCGGTEIGGAYVTSTLIENNYPSLFTTPALGSNFILIDDNGQPTDMGEVALIPPALGLSTKLLNANHHEIYFADMPKSPEGKVLRRHGDQLQRYANQCYSMLGRVDDTMNLGGIKISSAEIERALVGIEGIQETAAIALNFEQGPSHLIIYAVSHSDVDIHLLKQKMQQRINQHLNPLFKIHDVKLIDALPRTASNKIMRRVLRSEYLKSSN